MLASLSLIPVIDTTFLAREINDAHKQVTFHARSMLLEAKRAGDALIAAKGMVRHGEFKAWVKLNCRCSYRQAGKYMTVAKVASRGEFDPTMGIDAFLDHHSTARKVAPTVARQFSEENAEFALKLYAMATRGTGPERDTAITMLDTFAKQFGMAGEEAVAKAQALLPDQHKSSGQQAADAANKKLQAAEDRLTQMEQQVQHLLNRKEEIRAVLVSHSRDELIDLVVHAYLDCELPL